MNAESKKVGEFWDDYTKRTQNMKERIGWWQSPTIIRHYNFMISGEHLDGWNTSCHKLLSKMDSDRIPYASAISIGCGLAAKEIALVEAGLVRHIVCYDLSDTRVQMARETIREKGLADQIEVYKNDFFEAVKESAGTFDFVFWDNSLHHMMDAYEALRLSKQILKHGGTIFCNDYIGKSRFQYTDEEIAIANGVRHMLTDKYFYRRDGSRIRMHFDKPDLNWMIETDPSEAADSENIIPAFAKYFPTAQIINTGGLIWATTIGDIIDNIPEESEILHKLLEMDVNFSQRGFNQYAVIIAHRE